MYSMYGMHLGMQGVTSALNCTTSEVGNLKASKSALNVGVAVAEEEEKEDLFLGCRFALAGLDRAPMML